jgi:hypothetical protein
MNEPVQESPVSGQQPSGPLTAILLSFAAEVAAQLEAARAIAHPGESGRAREEIIRGFLRRIVPGQFSIDTGFVIDTAGTISRQVDIVIYRRDYYPVLEVGGVRYFLVEGVAAAIENKTNIDSKAALGDAIAAVASVKTLDRTAQGRNYYLDPGRFRELVNPSDFSSQVFTAILTDTCGSKELFAEAFSDHLGSTPREAWLNFLGCLTSFAAYYRREEQGQLFLSADTMSAQDLAFTNPDLGAMPPLLDFAHELINYLRVSARIDYRVSAYLPWGGAGDVLIPLPRNEDSPGE